MRTARMNEGQRKRKEETDKRTYKQIKETSDQGEAAIPSVTAKTGSG